jgi:hypothetical protein
LACAALRLPVLDAFARHVFFGRGSFPDVKAPLLRGPVPHAQFPVAGHIAEL